MKLVTEIQWRSLSQTCSEEACHRNTVEKLLTEMQWRSLSQKCTEEACHRNTAEKFDTEMQWRSFSQKCSEEVFCCVSCIGYLYRLTIKEL